MNNKISSLSKSLIFVAAAFLLISLFVPIWSIFLDAPQYPEGLGLQIWAHKIAGDVDIINGLNHYIGMKTLHTDDFLEFTVLPYIISFYVVLFLITAFVGKRKLLYTVLAAFVLFGIVAMADFWQWEYNYGHNLDPAAAIKVPGMTYQPPLIGFKQLLNFGAYSIPNIGGWLFIAAGLLLVAATVVEVKIVRKLKTHATIIALFLSSLFLSSCGNSGPEPIKYNKDSCDFCKMAISENQFAAEIITKKGRVYKFDDVACMLKYTEANADVEIKNYYVSNFLNGEELIDATTALFVKHDDLHSPMGGNAAAFANKEKASEYASKNQANVIEWNDLEKVNSTESNQPHEHSH